MGIKIGLLGGETDGEERMVQTEKQENLISDAFKATASFTNVEIFINILTFVEDGILASQASDFWCIKCLIS